MSYVPPTPIDSYPTMPCSVMTPNEVRRTLKYSNCAMDDVILYADNKVVASYSAIAKELDIPKPKYTNCPNCGAPVTGPICEYCGSVLDQAELDRQEQKQAQELAEKQRLYEQALRQWQQTQIKAELDQSIMNRMNYYGYQMSQCCCDTRTQMMQQSIVQSPDYIPKPVPVVIEQVEQEPIEDSGFPKVVIILASIIFVLLAAVLFAAFLA